MKRSSVFLAGFLVSSSALSQPTPEGSRVQAAIDVTIQNLDVVVTDSKGNPVHGLTMPDFELKQDGRLVRITNFLEVGAPARPSEAARENPESPVPPPSRPENPAPAVREPSRPPRHVVLFIDSLRLPEPDQRKVFLESMTSLLQKTLGPGDQAMIASWDGSIRTVLPFTSDSDLLGRVLGRIVGMSMRIPEEIAQRDRVVEDTQWFATVARLTGQTAETSPTAHAAAAEAYTRMKAKATALKGLLATMGGLSGRKVLVLASNRFSRYSGLEYFLGSRATVTDASDSNSREFDTKEILESVVQAANAQDVTLYTALTAPADSFDGMSSAAATLGDYPGLRSGVAGSREQLVRGNDVEALEFVALKTGGVTTTNVNKLGELSDRLATDLASWYSLGFPAIQKKGDSSISVHVKGPNLKVRVRNSIVVKAAEEQMKDRVLANLFQKDDRSPLPITVLPRKATVDKKLRTTVPVEVRIPIASLALLPKSGGGGVTGAFSVFAATAGSGGDFSEPIRQRKTFEIAERDLAKARLSYFTYELEIVTGSPESRISIGVWDELGHEAGFKILSNSHPAVGK